MSVYCITGVTGHPSPILRSQLVFPTRYERQLQGSDSDCFWHLGLLLLSVCLMIFPFLSSSHFLLFSLFDSLSETLFFHLHTHTQRHAQARNHIKPFSAAFKEDSWAYFKPKVLISYSSININLLCGSRGGSSYFCWNSPLVGGG